MKIPKTIKIGAIRYRVKQENDSFHAYNSPNDAKDSVGEHIPMIQTIRVSVRDNKRKILEPTITDTILHEVIHAVSRVYGIGLTENQVAGLSGGLMQVMRDNKLDFSK